MRTSERAAIQSCVQAAARSVLCEIASSIGPTSTERSIRDTAIDALAARGLVETWYYDCPALVLAGSRSCLSESGRTYVPEEAQAVGEFNLVTIDLSPSREGVWGDCARSFYVERGVVSSTPIDPEFVAGRDLLVELHRRVRSCATPRTTFHDLCEFADAAVVQAGFQNVDFLGNFGHSIATNLGDRIFIERGERRRLIDAASFTFEPHIRIRGGRWGFKHEDVYRFGADGTIELV
ncbi:MAG TPA: M24 family metallopeptidase [Pirellulaceae bacterium]|nr:M24 family metallopeptidase [Pirellulaceae bacterium]